MKLSQNLIEKIETWAQIESAMKKLKADEGKLRKEICTELFEGRQGTFTVSEEIKSLNLKITASSKTTLSLDQEALEDLDLSQEELECISWKPSLLKSKLDKIDEDSNLFEAITEKPATPSLKVKEID